MAASYVALFRGINVGGKNKINKATLVSLFEEAGARNIQTFIQSGNVIFTAAPKIVAVIPRAVCAQVSLTLGIDTHITLRSAAELKSVQERNPYADVERLYVAFLADAPSAERVALLDPLRSPPDQFTVSGREIYLLLEHAAKTKFTNAYFDSKLKTVSTLRNWRTLIALSEMMST